MKKIQTQAIHQDDVKKVNAGLYTIKYFETHTKMHPLTQKKHKTTMVRKYNMSKEESRKITGHDKSEDQCAL